jgi:hypothetical protein
MITALLTYTLRVYPQGVQTNQMVDPLVERIIKGASSTSWPVAETLAAIDGYKQQEEKDRHYMDDKMDDEWQYVEFPKGFVQVFQL